MGSVYQPAFAVPRKHTLSQYRASRPSARARIMGGRNTAGREGREGREGVREREGTRDRGRDRERGREGEGSEEGSKKRKSLGGREGGSERETPFLRGREGGLRENLRRSEGSGSWNQAAHAISEARGVASVQYACSCVASCECGLFRWV
eukprot:73910-Rhodomonas_salina.2